MNAIAGIGHNHPPPTLDELLDIEIMREQWAIEHKAFLERRDALLASAAKAVEKFSKDGIPDDVEAGKVTDLLAMLGKTANAVETTRKAVGRRFLDITAAINAFFGAGIVEPLKTAAATGSPLQRLSTAYLVKKAAAEKLKRETELREARAEADRIAEVAMKAASGVDGFKEAIAADDAAQRAEVAANAPRAELSRVRGDQGSSSSLVDFWVASVEDASRIPAEWWVLDWSKINAAIRRKDNPVRSIPGLVIKNDPQGRAR